MKLSAITIVLIEPTKNKKERLLCLNISEPIVAAWPEPIPGRNEQSGAEIADAIADFRNSDFDSFIFLIGLIICFASFEEEVFKEMTRAEEPNNPVKRGRRGSFTGRANVNKPRKPESMKINRDAKKFFSVKIR